jgi:CHAT domain-containing protein
MTRTPQEKAVIEDIFSGEDFVERLSGPPSPREKPRVIKLIREALTRLPRNQNPVIWAALHFELARSLAASASGNRAENIDDAIAHYETTLEIFTQQAYPAAWAMIQHNLAEMYLERITGERAQNVEVSMNLYKAALKVLDSPSETWATLQRGLANAYSNRVNGDPKANVDLATTYCKNALSVFTQNEYPNEWAKTQVVRGNIYMRSYPGADQAQKIEDAISCYESALSTWIGISEKVAIQSQLAIAYHDRMRGDLAQNREQVITLASAALENCKWHSSPYNCAKLQNLLANAYRDRLLNDRADNIETAIAYYEPALEIFTRQAFPENWAQIQKDLAQTYLMRRRGIQADNLQRAVIYYRAALEVFSRDRFPGDWAMVQCELGNALAESFKLDSTTNIREAIACQRAALEVIDQKSSPEHWARIQHSLANTYKIAAHAVDPALSRQAIQCYVAALETYESAHMRGYQRDVGIDLGDAASALADWKAAFRGYSSAVTAIEEFRTEVLTQEGEHQLIADNDRAFWGVIRAAAQIGQFAAVVEYIESAKSRQFLKLLGEKGYDLPAGLPEAWREEEAGLSFQKGELESLLKRAQGEPRLRLVRDLENTERELSALYSRIQAQAPEYVSLRRGRPPTLAEIKHFIAEQAVGTLLLEFFDLPDRILVLALSKEAEPLLVDLPLNQDRLVEFLGSVFEEIKQRPESSDASLPVSWSQLSEELLPKELDRLLEQSQSLLVIPSGLLNELPIHALLWNGEPLIAKYSVRYAPSISVAMRAQARESYGEIPMTAIGYVDDPQLKPVFEGEAIAVAELFGQEAIVGNHATGEAIVRAARRSRIMHVSCHGLFDFNDPMRSGLVIADGVLTAAAILTWDLPGSFVNLSACATGRNRIMPGDELYGLLRAFFYAGASSLVLGMWSVDAVTTLELMRSFYSHIREASDPASALRAAMLEIRKHKPHPFYWAPFFLVGGGFRPLV